MVVQLAKASVINAANASRANSSNFNVFPSDKEGILAQLYEESIDIFGKSKLSL